MNGLQLVGVSKDFAGVHAVRDVSFCVAPGEMVGLVGLNGSGKTTVVNLSGGASVPSTGRVLVDGRDLTGRAPPNFARAGVVRTFQGLRLFERLSVLDNVLIGAQRSTRPSLAGAWIPHAGRRRQAAALRDRAIAALEDVGMASFGATPVQALSHGQRRRVELARAFAAEPAYLVLDEPGAGVDPEQKEVLAGLLAAHRDAGVGMLLVEHDAGLVERLTDRVLGMANGAVVAEGSFAEVTTRLEQRP